MTNEGNVSTHETTSGRLDAALAEARRTRAERERRLGGVPPIHRFRVQPTVEVDHELVALNAGNKQANV